MQDGFMNQSSVADRMRRARSVIPGLAPLRANGNITGAAGLTVDIAGLDPLLAVGDRLLLQGRATLPVPAEIISFKGGRARAMPLGSLAGIGPGAQASIALGSGAAGLQVGDGWLGRIVDPLGGPLDDHGPLPRGPGRPVRAPPPPAAARARLGPRISLGVRALDLFATCRTGQRLGLFAGSGVGKSTLLAMLAQQARCDVVVLALVGERGREVREFIEDDLGPAIARSVVVVATSDQPPLLRREAAYTAMTIAEHFRDQGLAVLLLMDSVTRFCLALREIGLAGGEPPATRGYPPSMFAELPCLLERAGPGLQHGAGNTRSGSITALFTVLVEGDDHNEPIADAVRGILDGHVILDRAIGESGRYPAVDVLRSLSRTVPGCLEPEEAALVREARAILARQAELADLVRLGAYQRGADLASDRSLRLAPFIEALLNQDRASPSTITDAFRGLRAILHDDDPAKPGAMASTEVAARAA
jgi:flagellum-specific ATP synthase